jgi:outer membrane protein TolC
MNRRTVALLSAALAAVSACALPLIAAAAPSSRAVAAAMPTPTPAPARAGAAQPSPAPTSLTLSQAEEIALASSPQLALARAAVDQAQAGVGIARSGELPSIDASGNTTRSEATSRITVPNGKGGFTTTTQPFLVTSNNGALTLKQLILDGGRVSAEVQAAHYTTDASKLTLLRDVQTVLLTVAQQYYAALQARHQLQAAQQSLSVARVQEQLVEAQYHAGVASKADVLTAALPVAQAELTVASAQNGEAENIASLLTTMGLPATTPVMLQDDTNVSPSNLDVNQLISVALVQRTDLAAAKSTVSSAQASVRAAKLAVFPNLAGTATSGTSSTATNGGQYAPNWSLGASLLFPLYSGGLIKSQADQARAVEAQTEADYNTARLNVYLTVQQAYLGLVTADASLKAAKVALDQARVVLDTTNAQYRAGVTTLPLLLNAQSQLTTAQSNYVQALYAYKVAQQNVLYAEGTLSPS